MCPSHTPVYGPKYIFRPMIPYPIAYRIVCMAPVRMTCGWRAHGVLTMRMSCAAHAHDMFEIEHAINMFDGNPKGIHV